MIGIDAFDFSHASVHDGQNAETHQTSFPQASAMGHVELPSFPGAPACQRLHRLAALHGNPVHPLRRAWSITQLSQFPDIFLQLPSGFV